METITLAAGRCVQPLDRNDLILAGVIAAFALACWGLGALVESLVARRNRRRRAALAHRIGNAWADQFAPDDDQEK